MSGSTPDTRTECICLPRHRQRDGRLFSVLSLTLSGRRVWFNMAEGLFNQPFVYCNLCHRPSTKENPLNLTSCAHTLCSQHLNQSTCPVCGTGDILAIKLVEAKELPQEIKSLFLPTPAVLENLYNASQFQMTGLTNQCQYFQEQCIKLREKCARQRQLLYQAKEELDAVTGLRARIAELEAIVARGSIQNSHAKSTSSPMFTALKPPTTVDLTTEDHLQKGNQHFFLQKLKASSSLKTQMHHRQLPQNQSQTSSSSFGESFGNSGAVAESTQIEDFSLSPAKVPIVVDANSGMAGGIEKCQKEQSQFPTALDKLRIVKRNHTFNSNTRSFSRGNQGLTSHTRSSSTSQTQTALLMRRGTTSQGGAGPDMLASKGASNKFRRMK